MDSSFALASCPRCQHEVDKKRLQEAIVVCNHCGFVSESNQNAFDSHSDKRAVKTMAIASMVLVAAFIHVANWGSSSVAIIALKIKELLSMANVHDLEDIAQICTEQSKAVCVEQALQGIADQDVQNIEHRAKLASFQSRLNNLVEADKNFAQYFAKGGIRPEAAYEYALVLEKLNRIDEAARMFDFALINKPDVLQITVTQAYVRLLMTTSRYNEARKLIDSVRRQGDNARYFMAKEYDEIAKLTN
jgi:hypothetical protein